MLATNKVSVWLICRNPLIREGLRRILEENEFAVRRFFDGSDFGAVDLDENEAEGLMIIDCGSTGASADKYGDLRARFPSARIVILSDLFRLDQVIDAFRAGVDGYMMKEIGCESLLESLRLIRLGEKVLPSELINHLTSNVAAPCSIGGAEADVADLLSEREVETLKCLIQGFPNKVIAHRLDISEATVKVHVKAILRKLMVQNRTQAAIWAVNHGLDGSLAADGIEDERFAEWPVRQTAGNDIQIEDRQVA